jgi:hypothetical protein
VDLVHISALGKQEGSHSTPEGQLSQPTGQHIVEHPQVGNQAQILVDKSYAGANFPKFFKGERGQVASIHLDRPPRRSHRPIEKAQQGGLPRSAEPDESHRFT